MSLGHTRPASRRQAELDEWLRMATGDGVVDLATLRGTMRAPTNLLQHLAEAVLDSSVSVVPEGGLAALRANWATYDTETRGLRSDHANGMAVVADPLAACAAAVLGLVSPGSHVTVLEPAPPQIVDVVRRVGGVARAISMRPTEWEFDPEAFAQRVGSQTDLIILADPNPYSGQYLPVEAREAIVGVVEQFGCLVLLDESARQSVVEGEAPDVADFQGALGARCIRVDMPAASVLAQAASAASLMGSAELMAPIRSAVSAFGLGASVIAQSVLARRFGDGLAIDDAATLNGLVASGRALLLDGLDDIGVLGLGGPGGWYVPVRAKALYDGPHDICDALVSQAGLGALPLSPFYVEGSLDPYILLSYLRGASVLEHSLERLAQFSQRGTSGVPMLALPSPAYWDETDLDDEDAAFAEDDVAENDFQDDEFAQDEGDSVDDRSEFEASGYGVDPEVAPQSQEAGSLRDEAQAFDTASDQPDARASADRVPDLVDDDAKYRAAIAELRGGPVGEFDRTDAGSDKEDDHDALSEKGDDQSDPVILPFGRRRRGGRDSFSSGPEDWEARPGREDDEAVDFDAPTVFKLSVPDIASPNISAPRTTSAPPKTQATPAVPAKPADGKSNDAVVDQQAARDRKTTDAERVKKDDRPFFFDDPMV
jgi:N-succinyldiaminopimelate aminotransferase